MKKTLCCVWILLIFSAVNLSAAEPIPANAEKLALIAEGKLAEAQASWWGFDEEDATESLQAALNSGVKMLTIDKMASDWIVRPLTVPSHIEILLADDVTIRAKRGEFLGTSDSLFTISQKENVTLRGGKNSVLLMNKSDYHAEPYKLAEWRHGLNIKSSKNVRLDRLTIRETGGDGIYLGVSKRGVPCENIEITNVFCDGNNRQGISVISAKNLLIEDCNLSNTVGTAPEAGIDFEPNCSDECLVNCVMRRCVLNNNHGGGIALYLPNLNRTSGDLSLTFEDCSTTGNRQDGFWLQVGNGPEAGLSGSIAVKNCRFVSDGGAVRVAGKGVNDFALSFENVLVDTTPAEEKPSVKKSPVRLINDVKDETPLGGITLRNMTFIVPDGAPPIAFSDNSPFDFTPQKLSGDFTIKTAADAVGEKTTLDEAWLDKNFPPINRRRIERKKIDDSRLAPLDAAAAKEEHPPVLRPRNKAEWVLYGTKGETMTFSLSCAKIGKNNIPDVTPLLVSPAGSETKLEKIVGGKRVDYSVPADETGIWRLSAEAGTHAMMLTSVSVPNAMDFSRLSNLISTMGTFYFDVPEGTPCFGVKVTAAESQTDAERVTATMIDPNGTEVQRMENVTTSVFYDSGDTFTPGVWSIRFEKPTIGILEDFSVMIYGVAPLLTNERRFVLTEK